MAVQGWERERQPELMAQPSHHMATQQIGIGQILILLLGPQVLP